MKVLFIFSEGPHDVAFIKLVLESCCNIKHEKSAKILDFPEPLNSIFIQRMKDHAMGDLTLDMVHKFLLPNHVFKTDTHFIMLFNSGGMTNYSYVKQILSQIIQKIKDHDSSFKFSENDISCLFTYDADYRNSQERVNEIKKQLFPITVNDAYPEDWETLEKSPGVLLDSENKSVHFYIWSNNGYSGTLEDILLKIYHKKNSVLMENSTTFINKNFSENFKYTDEITERNIAIKANKLKACITVAGQGKKPSRPLTAIIADNVLADKESFISDEEVIKFSKFLKKIIDDK